MTDSVGFLSPETRSQLGAQLESYERNTGHQILGALAPDSSPEQAQSRPRPEAKPASLGEKILYGLIGIAILIFVITNPGLAFWLLLQILSSGGRGGGGGGGGGGGWSGGGGRGGGGGATGSW